jgi:hypothetical protein
MKKIRLILALLIALGLISIGTVTSTGTEKVKMWPASHQVPPPNPVPMGGSGGGNGFPPSGS